MTLPPDQAEPIGRELIRLGSTLRINPNIRIEELISSDVDHGILGEGRQRTEIRTLLFLLFFEARGQCISEHTVQREQQSSLHIIRIRQFHS